jgi:hypothetical protein
MALNSVSLVDLAPAGDQQQTGGPGANLADPPNGVVDVSDLLELLSSWGPCG